MKFECTNCGKQFIYAAKKLEVTKEHEPYSSVEAHVCPYCYSLDFVEAQVEASAAPVMVDIVECEVPLVKEYLERGYVVIDRYAKSIRLALYDKPTEETKNEQNDTGKAEAVN